MLLNFSKRTKISPAAWIAVDRMVQQVIWMVIFAILAPILGPKPYGELSVVMIIVYFCDAVLVDGPSEALLSMTVPDGLYVSTVNLTGIVLAVVSTILLAAVAPLMANIYDDPQLEWLLLALAPLPFIASLTASPIAILKSQLQYDKLAIRSILGLVVGGILGVTLAFKGAGAWALVFQVMGTRAAEVVILWLSVPSGMSVNWSKRHFDEMRSIAINVGFGRIMGMLGAQFPRLLIGYFLGLQDLGQFTLATRFADICVFVAVQPRTQVSRVQLRDYAPGTPEFASRFQSSLEDASFLFFPMVLGGALLVPYLYSLWLDERWQAGVVPAQLTLIGTLPIILGYCADSAFFGVRRSSIVAKSLTIQSITILVATLIAVSYGLVALSATLAVRAFLYTSVSIYLLNAICLLSPAAVITPMIKTGVGAIIMAIVVWLASRGLPSNISGIVHLIVLLLIGALSYAAYAILFLRDRLKHIISNLVIHRLRTSTSI